MYPNQSEKEKTGLLSYVPRAKPYALIYLLTLLLLPTQLGKHFWPSASFISGIRIDYLSPTFYLTDLLILVLLIPVFIKSFRNGLLKKAVKNTNALKITFIVVTFLLINILLSQNKFVSLYGALKICEFIFFAFLTREIIKKFNISSLVSIFSISIIVQSAISISQYINQGSLGGIFYFLGERSFSGATPGIANVSLDGDLILRAYGTFSHPNVLAGFLLLFLVFILFNLSLKRSQDILPVVSIILGTTALFLTFSRIPILLWIISIFIFIISRIKVGFKEKIMLASLIIIALITSIVFYAPFYIRFMQTSFFEESFALREKLILDGFASFFRSPVIGVGLNNYFSSTVLYSNTLVLQPVHNIFILILIQTGIIGFIFSIWGLYKTYKKILAKKIIYLKLIFFWILLIGFFDHYLLTLQQGQLMTAFFIGLFWSNND